MQTFIQKKELYTCCTLCTLVSLPPLHLKPYTLNHKPYPIAHGASMSETSITPHTNI